MMKTSMIGNCDGWQCPPSMLKEGIDRQVPRSMVLNECLRANARSILDFPLIPLNCTFGVVNEKDPIPLKAALKKERQKTSVSVVFVVRRPGCAACREHGQQLTELSKEVPGVAFWAIVKETGAEEEGILTFFNDYFHFPIYKDEKWNVYKAMGDRSLSPLKAIWRYLAAKGRWADKGIPNRFQGGDVWIQGGVLLFKKGKLRFAYEEDYGKELVISNLRAAIRSLQEADETTSTDLTECTESSLTFTPSRIEI